MKISKKIITGLYFCPLSLLYSNLKLRWPFLEIRYASYVRNGNFRACRVRITYWEFFSICVSVNFSWGWWLKVKSAKIVMKRYSYHLHGARDEFPFQ